MIHLLPKLRSVLLLIFVLLAGAVGALAQSGTIRGTVKDAKGNSLAGASVFIQGSSQGTTTGNDGVFSLSLNPGTYMVSASYVGLGAGRQSVTVTPGGVSTIDFVLVEGGQEETVVILGSRSLPRTQLETPAP